MIWKVDLQKTHFSFPYLFNIPRDYYLPEDSALFLMTDLRALAISYLQLQLKPRQSKSNKALEQGINLQMLTNSQEQHCCARNRHKRFRRECIWCQVEGLFDDGVKKWIMGHWKKERVKKGLHVTNHSSKRHAMNDAPFWWIASEIRNLSLKRHHKIMQWNSKRTHYVCHFISCKYQT